MTLNIFNQDEFNCLCKKYNKGAKAEDIEIKCSKCEYVIKKKSITNKERRGEVVFCVQRPNGKYILITCDEYPKGTFRVPTGGINYNEDIIQAIIRETKEELGLEVEISDFIGVLKIKFTYDGEYSMFYSYMFLLNEIGGRLLEDATDDEVSQVMEANLEDFESILQSLLNMDGDWVDWGRFRYMTSNAVYKYLKERNHEMILKL
ncbi:NUDIX hydrolase [Pseudobacteroides cellulosolvens]|uniref:NUDIX hydrolase n=1 Tax=Pseudobacteroides cellulosolvens ATCC 35603 = DSM 2933 TaxID=398512 RepID=A0A0L6JWG4_9FIRM|nr:NUDIX hydrolase [Pseudobacteroides cellulosolvens]KNY29757.1 NUDIX hydrolase [Pseudobacteroides cellulosolvens ATCC 35603 = DSM 2933]